MNSATGMAEPAALMIGALTLVGILAQPSSSSLAYRVAAFSGLAAAKDR